jgi:polar amino acid transport system substrate-binding protein
MRAEYAGQRSRGAGGTLALLIAAVCLAVPALASAENDARLDTKRPGELSVAVYKDYAPFSYRDEEGRLTGLDVDIAAALAETLGVRLSLREQAADESVEDDLRNAVWKGHYLGGGTADVMLHMPVDPVFAERNDQVKFVAPYYRERVLLAYRKDHVDQPTSPGALLGIPVGVEIETLADAYLLSAMQGRLREDVRHYTRLQQATDALVAGEVSAVMGNGVELQAFVDGHDNIAVSTVAMPGLMVTQWDVGAAVKAVEDSNLASRLNAAMSTLARSGRLDEIFESYGATRVPPSIQPYQAARN